MIDEIVTKKTIAFVTPWYGDNIPGGAEAELRGLVKHLLAEGVKAEILTTCVKQFLSDWNDNYYEPGNYDENGVPVKRFLVKKRDVVKFDAVNAKLMRNECITADEEQIYVQEMINSPNLYTYIKEHKDEYGLFIFIPYMFGTTFYGIQQCTDKAIMIPCFHDESYIYMDVFKPVFNSVRGMIFHAHPEQWLAEKVFDLKNVNAKTLGEGVDSDFDGDARRFRNKFRIYEPFILYAGRKESGKNVDLLIDYFCKYKSRKPKSDLKLLLIGGGDISFPSEYQNDISDLGFVERVDKYDAMSAATVLCQPSTHESFSLVMMESWLCKRPVLVHGECEVTKDFVKRVNGGLYFNDYFEFEGCMDFFMEHRNESKIMGQNGCIYVKENFSWDVIVKNYCYFFKDIMND